MHPHDMKLIGFKHQRENKQNSDKIVYRHNLFLNIPIPCYIFIIQMSLIVVGGGDLRIISCFT